jgi:hypothetical protein
MSPETTGLIFLHPICFNCVIHWISPFVFFVFVGLFFGFKLPRFSGAQRHSPENTPQKSPQVNQPVVYPLNRTVAWHLQAIIKVVPMEIGNNCTTVPIMTKYVVVLFCLVCMLTVLNGYSQENLWLKGTWSGVYFGEKSKLTKTFDTRLQISKVNGSTFEGTVQCILPTDTTIRLHTRITGRIYPHHIMTKLKEVTYFKDPPGRYTWAKHCNLCDSMKYTFEKVGDSVVLQGERRCDTLCNIVARYTKNIGSLVYKAAFLYDTDITPRKVNAKTIETGAHKPGAVTATGKPVAANFNTSGSAANTSAAGANNTGAVTPSGKPVATNIAANGAANNAAAGTNTTGAIAAGGKPVSAITNVNTASASAGNAATGTKPTAANNPATTATGGTNSTNTATAKTGGPGVDFVKPVYKDSLVGRDHFAGRSVNTPNRYVINADSAEIRFMDNGIVDGDTISVYYNGQLIIPKLSLKEKPYIIKVPLFPDYPNRLVIHAESLGIYPPNTALVRIIFGKKEESFLLSSSMSKSGSVELMNNKGSTVSNRQ